MTAQAVYIPLLYNTALLLALVLIFDIATSRFQVAHNPAAQVITGSAVGLICIGVMMAPFQLEPGLIFDTRSVVLSVTGLFFGLIPTLIAALLGGTYRLAMNDGGALAGVAGIFVSGLIGVLYRHWRRGGLEGIRARELLVFGLGVQATIVLLMLMLLSDGARIVGTVWLPFITLYPAATVALGMLLSLRLTRDLAARQLAKSETLYRSLVDSLPQNIYRSDREGRITFANKVFLRTLNTTEDKLLGTIAYDLAPPEQAQHYRSIDAEVLATGETATLTMTHPAPDGSLRHIDILKTPTRTADGRIDGLQCVFEDITERKLTEARIHRLAFYDTLTDLPNRSLLMDRLAQSLASDRRASRVESLLLLNIDRFKIFNDARGYRLGDALLSAFGERLRSLQDAGGTFARMAGDEFAILLPDTTGGQDRERSSKQALVIAESVHAGLKQPFRIDNEEFMLTVSIGITLFPDCADDTPEAILRRADNALHRAKAAGGDQTAFFDIRMGESAAQSFRIERELRQAIAGGELRLFLQSQVRPGHGVVGAEALIRWQHPQRGLLSPGHFIAVAEESNLIVQLGAWVLTESCQLAAAEARSGKPLQISVNISPRQFRQRDFVPWLRSVLAHTGVNPRQLTLEITEGLVINNVADVTRKMGELAALGVRFSIDDFGTGYSSLAYLKRLPIHELKIDQSFIQDAPHNPNDAALVETILSVASHLQLSVVAEGIETAQQADFLIQRAAIVHQGYFYGEPQPAADWLEARRNGAL